MTVTPQDLKDLCDVVDHVEANFVRYKQAAGGPDVEGGKTATDYTLYITGTLESSILNLFKAAGEYGKSLD